MFLVSPRRTCVRFPTMPITNTILQLLRTSGRSQLTPDQMHTAWEPVSGLTDLSGKNKEEAAIFLPFKFYKQNKIAPIVGFLGRDMFVWDRERDAEGFHQFLRHRSHNHQP